MLLFIHAFGERGALISALDNFSSHFQCFEILTPLRYASSLKLLRFAAVHYDVRLRSCLRRRLLSLYRSEVRAPVLHPQEALHVDTIAFLLQADLGDNNLGSSLRVGA